MYKYNRMLVVVLTFSLWVCQSWITDYKSMKFNHSVFLMQIAFWQISKLLDIVVLFVLFLRLIDVKIILWWLVSMMPSIKSLQLNKLFQCCLIESESHWIFKIINGYTLSFSFLISMLLCFTTSSNFLCKFLLILFKFKTNPCYLL